MVSRYANQTYCSLTRHTSVCNTFHKPSMTSIIDVKKTTTWGESGFPSEFLGEYGEEFLALIRHYSQEQGMTERPIPSRRRQRNERPIPQCSGEKIVSFPRPASTYEETKKLFLQKLSISEIANLRGLAKNTILGHLERLVLAGERLEFDHLIPSSTRFARIEAAFQETANHFLAPVRELLGEEYSYEELHLVRLCLRQRQGIAS